VRIASLYSNHRKTLIFNGTLIFQRWLLLGTTLVSRKAWYIARYIELSKNLPLWFKDHLNISGLSINYISINLNTKACRDWRFSTTKFLRKETFSGLELKISAIVASFLRTILYKFGYCMFNGVVPNHESSQNLICLPSCRIKVPMLKNSSLTLIKPLQNWESPDLLVTWVIVLEPRYLLLPSPFWIDQAKKLFA
jgi:hypothetical protein